MRFHSVLLGVSFLSGSLAAAAVVGGRQQDDGVETLSLDELYDLAIAEGGQLIVKAGGDEKNQQDSVIQAFQEKFPKINITLTVDLSKYHDSVIDRSLNQTGIAGTDVAHLQTLHDFIRWKEEGRLLSYKPAGWDQIPDDIKDADQATYVGIAYLIFTNNFATAKIDVSEAPIEFLDYLDPKWKGKIVSTYPNDDDAVLFEFYKIQQTHGWDAINSFIAQDVQWVRGTATPASILLADNDRAVSFTTDTGFTNGSSGVFQQLPESDFSHSIIWAQRAAIFETAEHPHAAKLYLNWLLSEERQTALGGWSVRTDVAQQDGLKVLSEYSGKLDPAAFEMFMVDRALVERYRFQFEQLLGTAQGLSPLDDGL
ncbi:ABC-type Fe3+ transport system, periplasmic component [Guyanagaster necrorhizus]|uniref:ABC-type Fe3+ transport system, periplasmic component n=1 Tax=Guyanagaster necrorhizus TaxID=856835 RepID=A0A9P8AW70_9AGAR|nr:ABC-type Fe3+ transport system, periplasmic component [Guyanagaster necrorhizus MCA 3950]KAG7448642.1 ABC-type Fe3+ transport system, periplasmic component [Guyanagaster necrorhizus MCA 3950]